MNEESGSPVCPACGKELAAGADNCSDCGWNAQVSAWEQERDRLKKLWVMAVTFFWFSVVFQGALYFLEGTLNLVLLSVICGMMVLGFILKFRLQLHMRRKPLG